MCGFAGLCLATRQAHVDDVQPLARALEHRGPDDEKLFARGPVALGFRRLSIIDVAGGAQPLFNETNDVAVMCNGEIYNFAQLRRELESKGHSFRTRSDVETLVHLYEEKGAECVQDLVGMFAFCIVDFREQGEPRVFLGRDRLGIKPLYYARGAEGVYWASEPKAILESGAFERELRPQALLDYLVQGYTGGPNSAFGQIERVAPGTTVELKGADVVRARRYWDLPLDGLRDSTTDDEVLEWLDRVVADRLVADVPLGAFLSGGIDSTAVVDSMARARPEDLIACSVGFNERSHNELEIACATAEQLGATHHTQTLTADPTLALEVLPWFFDEPHADPSTVPTYLVSKMAREHVTVALSGDGGDEIFAGYRRYVHDVAENRVRQLVGAGGRAFCGVAGRIYPKLDWAPRFLRGKTFLANIARDPARAYWESVSQLGIVEARELLAPDVRRTLGDYDPFDAFADHYARPKNVDPLYRAQYGDFHTNLPDRILSKVDRASMAASLEARVPLLDHRFVERFANLPTRDKVVGARGKHALREALRQRLRPQVLDGAKRGFDTPLATWIRGSLKDPVRDAVESIPSDWFSRAALQRCADEHAAGRRDHARLLWSILVLEHWRRRHAVARLCA